MCEYTWWETDDGVSVHKLDEEKKSKLLEAQKEFAKRVRLSRLSQQESSRCVP